MDKETLQLWDADHVSPATEIDSFLKSNGTLLWTQGATFRRVSAHDLEIEIHQDKSIMLVKGDLQDKIFYHVNMNDTEKGILRMFTDKTAPSCYRGEKGEVIEISDITAMSLEML
jgi:hypothetical protein